MHRIVVGIDGSEGATAALAWAIDEARQRKAQIVVVTAFGPPEASVIEAAVALNAPLYEQLEQHARELQDRAIDKLEGDLPKMGQRIVLGSAATVLLEEAAHADLLVIGSRGLGGFRGLLLGSVSHKCVSHAPCPVVVIPPGATEHGGE